MTLSKLVILAIWGTHEHPDATAEDWEEIRDFAMTWMALAEYNLEDIRLSAEDLREWDPTDTWR